MKRGHSILLVSVLLFGLLVLFGCQSKELTSAKVYIQQDDWKKAEEQLKMAVELYPNDAEAHALLGEAYGRKGKYEKMNKEFEASLAITPKHSQRIKYLRDKYWVQNFNNGVNQIKTADKAYQEGNDKLCNKKLSEALNLFMKCPQIDPKRVDAYKNIAYVYSRMDSIDKAIQYYEKVLELNPKDTKVMLRLGDFYYDQKEYDKCIDLMDRILQLEPDNLDALSRKAFAYDLKGETDKAFEEYKKALAKRQDNPDLLFNLGRLYYQKKDYENAIVQFKKVLEKSPDDVEATLNIGNAYLNIAEKYMAPIRKGENLTNEQLKEAKEKAIENYKAAIPYLEKAAQIKSDDSILWTNLGVAYINAGMKEKGEEAFKKAENMNK